MLEPAQPPVETKPETAKRPFQFGLRTLLALPVVIALFFALAAIVGMPSAIGMYAAWLIFAALCFRRTRPAGCLVLVLLGVMFLLPLISDPGPIARRVQCGNNLKQIGLALHNYHHVWGCFPPGVVRDAQGRPIHSWRTLILPYLDEQALHAKYRFDELWDGPNNSQLAQVPLLALVCPEQQNRVPAQTSYLAVAGPGSAWPDDKPASLSDFKDGASNTILVVEVKDSGVLWMEPADLDIRRMPKSINRPARHGISSRHSGGAHALFADGSVRFLSDKLLEKTLSALLTRNGGEPLDAEKQLEQ